MEIVICNNCLTKILPTSDNTCPRCLATIDKKVESISKSANDKNEEDALNNKKNFNKDLSNKATKTLLVTCYKCLANVLPKSDNICPRCGSFLDGKLEDDLSENINNENDEEIFNNLEDIKENTYKKPNNLLLIINYSTIVLLCILAFIFEFFAIAIRSPSDAPIGAKFLFLLIGISCHLICIKIFVFTKRLKLTKARFNLVDTK